MGTKLVGDHLSMGTKFLGTICPWGQKWLGTVCPVESIGDQLWGTKCPGTICVWDQMCHSPAHFKMGQVHTCTYLLCTPRN